MTLIPGLTYKQNFITYEQELALVNHIDQEEWNAELKRRVQHYGFKYDYKTRNISQKHYLGPLPDWLMQYCKLLFERKIFAIIPNQVIVNEYEPGQGIATHIDCLSCFGETIASISLLSNCVMNFQKNIDKRILFLEPKSLLILQDEARYKWQHSIAPKKTDKYDSKIIPRTRRLSITFRNVIY